MGAVMPSEGAGSLWPRRSLGALVAAGLAACVGDTSTEAREAIGTAIARSVEATRTQDIDAYMAGIPEDMVLLDEAGEVITREQQREAALQAWSIIPRTLAISVTLDSMTLHGGDSATVFTSQRWERLMLQRDGRTTDTVLTTQRHRETWRKTRSGWFAYEVEELGGEVFVNGTRFDTGA